jgi:hypothetical protein
LPEERARVQLTERSARFGGPETMTHSDVFHANIFDFRSRQTKHLKSLMIPTGRGTVFSLRGRQLFR